MGSGSRVGDISAFEPVDLTNPESIARAVVYAAATTGVPTYEILGHLPDILAQVAAGERDAATIEQQSATMKKARPRGASRESALVEPAKKPKRRSKKHGDGN